MQPDELRPLRAAAADAQLQGKQCEALRIYDRICRERCASGHDRHSFGELLLHYGKVLEGLHQLRLAAQLYSWSGDVSQAVALCRRILGIDPKDARIRALLGSLGGSEEEKPLSAPDAGALPAAAPSLTATALSTALGAEPVRSLVAALPREYYSSGAIIARQGEAGSLLYLIAEGRVGVVNERPPPHELARIKQGGFIGEMAALCGIPRTATLIARAPTVLTCMPRAILARLLGLYPPLKIVFFDVIRERLLSTIQTSCPLVLGLPPSRRTELTHLLKMEVLPPGRVLVRAGQPSPGVFLLLAGRWELASRFGTVEQCGPGPIAGAESLCSIAGATASVTAKSGCFVFVLPRERYASVVRNYPSVLAQARGLAAAPPRELRNPS